MSRKNYRKKREKSFGYADAVENVQWGSQTASVIFQGAFSPVPISNKSTRGLNPNSRGILFQNGSISNFFAGHRRRIPIPRLIPGPPPERFEYPFKTWINLSGETYLGGDRPSFQPVGLAGESPLGFTSYGQGQLDYAFDLRKNDGTDYNYVGLGQNTYDTTIPDILNYVSLGAWRSQEPNTIQSNIGRVVSLPPDGLVGTPEDAILRQVAIDYPPVVNGWEGSYPESYAHVGTVTSISRTYTILPGYNGAPNTTTANSGTYSFTDEFIGQGVGGGPTTLTGCVEADAALPDLGFFTDVTVPGRKTTINTAFSVQWSTPEPTTLLVNGVQATFASSHNYSETYSKSAQAELSTRDGQVVAFCAGTGSVSFIPRVHFRIDWELATLTGQGSETLDKLEEFSFQVGLLNGIQVNNSQTYFNTINFNIPSTTADHNEFSGETWILPATINTNEGSTQEINTPLFYDNFFEACLYLKRVRSEYETLDKTETRGTFTLINFNSSNRIPESLEDTLNIFSAGSWINRTADAQTISMAGNYVFARDESSLVYYRDATQEIELGESTTFLEGQITEDLSTKNVGDTITTGLIGIQSGRNYRRSLVLPAAVGDSGAVTYDVAIDPTAQVVGRRFIVIQDLRGSGQNYKLFICTGVSVGAETATSQNTYTETKTFSSITMSVTEIIPNFYSPPRGGGNRFFRWDDYNDFYRSSVFETYKRSDLPGVLIEAFYVSGHLDTTTDQKWGYSTAQLLDTGKIAFTGSQTIGDFVGYQGTTRAIKVNP